MVVLVLCPVCRAGSALFACVAVERCEDVLEYDLFAAWWPVHYCQLEWSKLAPSVV